MQVAVQLYLGVFGKRKQVAKFSASCRVPPKLNARTRGRQATAEHAYTLRGSCRHVAPLWKFPTFGGRWTRSVHLRHAGSARELLIVRSYLASRTIARNEMVDYTPQSHFFADLEKARLGQLPWYQVLTEPGFVLGRTDPHTDPGGYYAVMVAHLAQRYYEIPDLEQRLIGGDTNPAQLLTAPTYTTTKTGATPDDRFGYLSGVLGLTLQYTNRGVLVEGPEIVIRPVRARRPVVDGCR